jgi:hypothetical protein
VEAFSLHSVRNPMWSWKNCYAQVIRRELTLMEMVTDNLHALNGYNSIKHVYIFLTMNCRTLSFVRIKMRTGINLASQTITFKQTYRVEKQFSRKTKTNKHVCQTKWEHSSRLWFSGLVAKSPVA